MQFILIFDEEDRDRMISLGYKLISTLDQGKNKVYQFKNDNKLKFNEQSIKLFKYSNLMLF